MGLAQEEHAESGLADASAHREGQLIVEDGLLEGQVRAVLAAGLLQLFGQGLSVDPDAHGGELQGNIEHRIVDQNIRVELPVVVVRRPPVVGETTAQLVADLHDADGSLGPGDDVLPLLGGLFGEPGLQLLGGDEINIVGQDLFNIIIADRHVFLGLSEDPVDIAHDVLEGVQSAVLFADDLFPVPLVHIDRVDVVRYFIAPDRAHVGVESLADLEAVLFQGVALPLGQRLDDLPAAAVLLENVKIHRTFDSV